MTTKLLKPIERECTFDDGDRPVLASLEPGNRLAFRVKGLRTSRLVLSLPDLYLSAKNDARRRIR